MGTRHHDARGSIVSALCFTSACLLVDAAANLGSAGEIITREIAWDGSESMTVDVPADVEYHQEPGPGRRIATGRLRSIDTLAVTGGHIHDGLLRTGARLRIVASAPNVKAFSLKGSDKLTIESLDQERLTISMPGSSALRASGRAARIGGAARGREREAGDERLDGARIAASERAELFMTGSTEVKPLSAPVDLVKRLDGNARVIQESPAAR